MANITNITPPRVPFLDERTGLISREWYRFLLNLFNLTGAGTTTISIPDMAQAPDVQPDMSQEVFNQSQLAAYAARYDDLISVIQGAYLNPASDQMEMQFDPLSYCAPRVELSPDGFANGTTGTGKTVLQTNPILITPNIGTPSAGVLTNATGLPLTTGITGTLAVANGGTGVTSSTGSVAVVLSTSPTLVTPNIGAATATSVTINSYSAGTWTTPTYSAGDYTGNGAMTWDVGSGDVVTYSYTIVNKLMTVNFYIVSSTVGGTPSTLLQIAIPASKTSESAVFVPALVYNDAGGANTVGSISTAVGGSVLRLGKLDGSNWSAATNTTAVYGSITFGIN